MGKDYFEYKVREEDPSLKEVREEDKFFGFNESMPLKYDKEYLSLWDSILKDDDIATFSHFKFDLVSKKYLRDSLQIYDELGISLHKVHLAGKKIRRLDDDELKTADRGRFLELIPLTRPDKIPIHFYSSQTDEASICWSGFYNKKEKFLVFEDIFLPLYGNMITACFYLHEIAHSQIIGVNRGIRNMLNKEVIPNFIDQIAAIKIDPTGVVLRNLRYSNAKVFVDALKKVSAGSNLEFSDRLEKDTFVQSVLEATNLANIYFGASTPVKREMLGDVGKIFDGEMFTEEMLSKYGSGIDAVFKDVKVFKKI